MLNTKNSFGGSANLKFTKHTTNEKEKHKPVIIETIEK
jgi:hypothetical protein